MGLDERHHTILQALLRRGPLPEKETKKMFRELFGCSDDKFFDFLSTVNKELDYVQMEVRGCANQYNGILYYGLVNKLANEEAKHGTHLTHAQLTFFKAILESILSDPSASGAVSSMKALNLRLDTQNETQTHTQRQTETQTQAGASTSQAQAAPLKITLAAKEETLASLVSDNWLDRTEDGMVCLGTRTFLELRTLFKNFDMPFCDVCNEAAIKAQRCQNEDCNVRMHYYCVPRKFSRRQVPRVCLGCSTAWKMPSGDDDDAAMDSDQNIAGEDGDARVRVPATQPRSRARRTQKRGKAKLEESSDDHDDDDSDGAPPAPSQPLSQSLGRKGQTSKDEQLLVDMVRAMTLKSPSESSAADAP